MSSTILANTSIAAVNNGATIRVYSQDKDGSIREMTNDNGWHNTNWLAKGQVKLGSPIAATLKKGTETRVFYLSTDNKLRELVTLGPGKPWAAGPLNASNFAVAPFSKLAALILPDANGGGVRLYAQNTDCTIQEFGLDASTWFRSGTNLGVAVDGSALAATTFTKPALTVKVYFQTKDLKVFEKAYDLASNKWITGTDTKYSMPIRGSMSICTWGVNSLFLRLFITTAGNSIFQGGIDNNASNGGGVSLSSAVGGTQSAAVAWGQSDDANLEMRVYFQNGVNGTGITEWTYSTAGNWRIGTPAIA